MTEDNDYGRFEELERETITEGIVKKSGHEGSLNFLRDLPFNQAKWISRVGENAREQVDLEHLDDDQEIAWYLVEQVKLYDRETGEFDVRYEGRWGISPVPDGEA